MAHAATSSTCSECIKLSQRVAELQERIHTLHSIREDEEFLDSVLATQTADKTVPATGKERDVSLHCHWDMLGAKPKLILASTPNPANNNSDKGWILVRGKERGSNQHNGCGKQPSSGQNILLDNRYEALASTRVEEIEQSHINILPPSPGHQGHQAQHNLHQRNNSSLASKQQHGNNSGHMRINHQTANRASRQHANKHAKGISYQNGNTCANHLASSHARQLAKSVSHQCGHTRPNHQLANHAGRQLTNVHANRGGRAGELNCGLHRGFHSGRSGEAMLAAVTAGSSATCSQERRDGRGKQGKLRPFSEQG
ncbi:hypothetical protein SRHO_G00250450 [Serrasalmus rhombeus]